MASGDDTALLELHARYAPHLMALMRRMVGGNASEGVEETFARAWKTADTFELTRESARAWLVVTAHRVALERKQSGSVAPASFASGGVQSGANFGVNANASLKDGHEVAGDGAAAEGLELLDKAFYEGCSLEELAAATGASPAAVGAALRAALDKLAQTQARTRTRADASAHETAQNAQNAERGDDA